MDVILLERIERLGQMGDVVAVKSGFARNYLLPQRKALRATKDNRTLFDSQRTQLEAANLERREEAEAVAGPLAGKVVTLIRQASDMGQLYGSVTSRDLAEAVIADGVTISRGQIVLNRPIKSLGLHQIRVMLHPEVSVNITANIARTIDEAATQIERGTAVLGNEPEADDTHEAESDAADGPGESLDLAVDPDIAVDGADLADEIAENAATETESDAATADDRPAD